MIKNKKMLSRTNWWWMRMRLSLASLAVVSLLMALLGGSLPQTARAQGTILYVAPGGSCGGASPCYASIQAAINAASINSSDTIKVAQGTYPENLLIYWNKAVILLGGYSTSNWNTQGPASSTIINGSGGSNSVIQVLSNATVDNFTITGGSTNAGGGIYNSGSASTISDNIIQGNSANYGGGIYLGGVGQPQILNNTISSNTAVGAVSTGWGGGICILDGASPLIKGNTISNNLAYWGGGINLGHSRATIDGNLIMDNRVQGGDAAGGGIFSELAVPIIRNNVIARNTSSLYGDGIYIKLLDDTHSGLQAQIINNTIVANKYSESGIHEGIHVRGDISPLIYNNIVALNGYGIRNYPYQPASPVLSNNDVWGNSVTDYSNLSPGTNDISADPLFVDESGGDYHLQAGSPCIDAGTSNDAPDTDFDGDPRPLDGNGDGSALWDIGADEYTLWVAKRASPSFADPGDTITYIITYRNDSTSTATGVVITDILPSNLLNPNVTSSGANITPRGGTTYVWDVEDLSPGSGGTISITARIDPHINTPTAIQNTAQYAVETDSFSDDALVIVGGLKTYLPLILKDY
jgi:uncharacterized repeat protein (TIGR01451 family)